MQCLQKPDATVNQNKTETSTKFRSENFTQFYGNRRQIFVIASVIDDNPVVLTEPASF